MRVAPQRFWPGWRCFRAVWRLRAGSLQRSGCQRTPTQQIMRDDQQQHCTRGFRQAPDSEALQAISLPGKGIDTFGTGCSMSVDSLTLLTLHPLSPRLHWWCGTRLLTHWLTIFPFFYVTLSYPFESFRNPFGRDRTYGKPV